MDSFSHSFSSSLYASSVQVVCHCVEVVSGVCALYLVQYLLIVVQGLVRSQSKVEFVLGGMVGVLFFVLVWLEFVDALCTV
jgi:hypothetical protein